MTCDGYYAAIKALGLTPSNVLNVFIDREGAVRSVPDPTSMTPDQRTETLAKIRSLLSLRD
jgi:antitoxin component of RelBE/YafQ-DinJ toxin-antitoxin module